MEFLFNLLVLQCNLFINLHFIIAPSLLSLDWLTLLNFLLYILLFLLFHFLLFFYLFFFHFNLNFFFLTPSFCYFSLFYFLPNLNIFIILFFVLFLFFLHYDIIQCYLFIILTPSLF